MVVSHVEGELPAGIRGGHIMLFDAHRPARSAPLTPEELMSAQSDTVVNWACPAIIPTSCSFCRQNGGTSLYIGQGGVAICAVCAARASRKLATLNGQ
jgi:hypothetical protein